MRIAIYARVELEALGVVFVVPGHIDMTTPMGRMPAHLLAAVAELNQTIRERVLRIGQRQGEGQSVGASPRRLFTSAKGSVSFGPGEDLSGSCSTDVLECFDSRSGEAERKKLQGVEGGRA